MAGCSTSRHHQWLAVGTQAQLLKDAGLQRITVSLDGLDDAIFQRMNDVGFPVADVFAGIEAARAVGLGPIEVNMVVKRGNKRPRSAAHGAALPRYGRHAALHHRVMDVGETNGWRMDEVLPARELLQRLQAEFDLRPPSASAPGRTAERWGHADDGSGEIGLISSVTQAFAATATAPGSRPKVGHLPVCHPGWDLRHLVRAAMPRATRPCRTPSPPSEPAGRPLQPAPVARRCRGRAARRDALHRRLSA